MKELENIKNKVIGVFTRKELKIINDASKKYIHGAISLKPANKSLNITIENYPYNLVSLAWYIYSDDSFDKALREELYDKILKMHRKLNKLVLTVKLSSGRHAEYLISLFEDKCCEKYNLYRYYNSYIPTLDQAKTIYNTLTQDIICKPDAPYQYFIIRKNIYNYVKRNFKVDLT